MASASCSSWAASKPSIASRLARKVSLEVSTAVVSVWSPGLEVPDPGRVAREHELTLVGRDRRELLLDDLARVGPARHRMRVVGRPEQVLDTEYVAQLVERGVLLDE